MLTYRRALFLFLVLNLIFLLGRLFCDDFPPYLLIVPVGLFLFSCFYGSAFICSNFYLRATCKIPTGKRQICLTFDDGPDPVETKKVLQVLKKHDVKAAFFIIGKKAENQQDILNQMIADGHIIGNHSYQHHFFSPLKLPGLIEREIKLTKDLIEQFSPEGKHYFRPPFGVTNPMIARAVKRIKPEVIGWSLRSFDTVTKNPERLLQRLIRKTKPGSIVLLHDRIEGIHKVLDSYIHYLKKENYSFLTIEELFKG